MEAPLVGDIVVVMYPFSDLSGTKRRPALIISPQMGDDLLLCQITSRTGPNAYTIPLQDSDLADGKLQLDSYIRINKISTIEKGIIEYKMGKLKTQKTKAVLKEIQKLFDA